YTVATEQTFVVSDLVNVGPFSGAYHVTVPAGSYMETELEDAIQDQLPSGWTFQIVGGYAQFDYAPSTFSVSWNVFEDATDLRDFLGFTGNVTNHDSSVSGPYTGATRVGE